MADLQKLEEDKTAAFQSRMQRAKELKAEQERKQKLKQKQKQKQQQQQQKKLERPEEEEEASAGTAGATTHRKNSAEGHGEGRGGQRRLSDAWRGADPAATTRPNLSEPLLLCFYSGRLF